MAKPIDLAALVDPRLVPGEEAIAAVRVNWNGMMAPDPIAQGQGLSGLAAPAPEAPDPDALVEFPSARQMLLVLTGGRLLAWGLGFSGRPKDFIGEVPLTAVADVSYDESRFGGLLHITMKSTASVDLEVMRGEPGEPFFVEVSALIAS
jgi:hypothetical protein